MNRLFERRLSFLLLRSVDIYKYCGCWYSMPADLYDCANVILEIRPNPLLTSTIPTSVLLSTALLTGPILPATATATIATAKTPISVAVVAVEPLPLLTVYATSTVLVTDCGTRVTNCPVSTRVTSYPIISSIPSTVSPPIITPTLPPHTLPVLGGGGSSSYFLTTSGGVKSTSTFISLETQTRTATITSCPPTVTKCPADYSSFSIYTATVTKTIYSCDGGCDEAPPPPAREVCVPKKRVRLAKRGEL